MGINDYIRGKRKEKSMRSPTSEANTSFTSPQEAVEAYSRLSQEELMRELFRIANESREKGELNNESLDNFFSNVSPMLTPEQRARMQQLLGDLKR
ncbi:MAG: hypothetical protein ACOYIQ_04130 [Christensenellales bacterium]|jgi:hypothetical protein